MKILILGFTKLKYMPYLDFYIESLNKEHDISILYWNRDLKEEDVSKFSSFKLYEFKCFQLDEVAKYKKVLSFLKYKTFVKKILAKGNFDFLIVLHTLPGLLISKLLIKRYSNHFILDYRDSTYENHNFFKAKIGNLVKASKYTFVSSDGFRIYLPDECKNKIFTSHNLLIDSLNHRDDKRKSGIVSNKIRISFWGFIRHKDVNIALIDRIASDHRFELHYYGREQDTALALKEHALKIGASNIFFHGEYKPEERYKFILETDLIHNIYFDDNMMLAMGNKYYDGIVFRIPQICMPGSFMGQKVSNNNLGIECSPYDYNFCDIVYQYYTSNNFEQFKENCDKELETILFEFNHGKKILYNLRNE